MPYYQRSWNKAFTTGDSPKAAHKLRTVAVVAEAEVAEATPPPPEAESQVDTGKVAAFRDRLTKANAEIQASKAALPITDPNSRFLDYAVQKDQIIFSGQHSEIYGATNAAYGEMKLIVREFLPSSLISPDDDLYLKMLRFLGNKSPAIIGTMDIYVDSNRHIFLFQEYANRGNALDYLRGGSEIDERVMHSWATSVYSAMDFLGDAGISHRAIHPKHMQVYGDSAAQTRVKLAGFRDAVLYWDPVAGDIVDQPCKALPSMKYLYFHAPESFGSEGEFFNPLEADVWSLGASMLYSVSRMYPFNLKQSNPNMDAEIRKTIGACDQVSDGAKYWLYGLLRANTKNRTSFEAIAKDGWFTAGPPPPATSQNAGLYAPEQQQAQ